MIEIKEPSSARRGIEAAVRKAIKQILAIQNNLKNGIVVICLDGIVDVMVDESKSIAIRRAEKLRVPNLILIYKGRMIYKRIKNKITVR